MINYVLYKNKNKKTAAYGKWYARALHNNMTFDDFIRHMAEHHCVYSEGTIRGVLIEMECCLRELLLEGKSVKFDELGIFSLGIRNRGGVDNPSDFNVAQNIGSVNLNLYLGKRFLARNLRKEAKFKEAWVYDVDSSKKAQSQSSNPNNG